jgi:hypothetical protein
MFEQLHAKFCSRASSRQGATVVEMAVVSMVLFTILVSGIELTRVTMLRHSADHAAYIGARRGIITGATAENVEEVVQSHMDAIGIRDATVTVIPEEITEATTQVEVEVGVPLAMNTWISPELFGKNLKGRARLLTERAAMVMSQSMPTPPPPPPPPPEPEPEPEPNPEPQPEPNPDPEPAPEPEPEPQEPSPPPPPLL